MTQAVTSCSQAHVRAERSRGYSVAQTWETPPSHRWLMGTSGGFQGKKCPEVAATDCLRYKF